MVIRNWSVYFFIILNIFALSTFSIRSLQVANLEFVDWRRRLTKWDLDRPPLRAAGKNLISVVGTGWKMNLCITKFILGLCSFGMFAHCFLEWNRNHNKYSTGLYDRSQVAWTCTSCNKEAGFTKPRPQLKAHPYHIGIRGIGSNWLSPFLPKFCQGGGSFDCWPRN